MKNHLYCQASEYDCGPTTLSNALRFLYEREEIAPEILKTIYLYTLDAYNEDGEACKQGTSRMAMRFLAEWFNQYGRSKRYPISAEYLRRDQVYIGEQSRIVDGLRRRGVVVARVTLDRDDHYVLLTGIRDDHWIEMFDPYELCEEDKRSLKDAELVEDRPYSYNRVVSPDILNSETEPYYALGQTVLREAMLIFNTRERLSVDNTVEYMI